MAEIHTFATSADAHSIIQKADAFYDQKKERIAELQSLALLDGLIPQMLSYKDTACEHIEVMQKPAVPATEQKADAPKNAPKKVIRAVNRQIAFPAKRLETEADVDAYVENMRERLKQLMQNCDGIQLN